ncbi:MAG: chloride channel protein [Armatimonadota bacterium]
MKRTRFLHYARILAAGTIVGAIGGFGAIGFRWLIIFFDRIFFETIPGQFPIVESWWIIVAPALGGALVGPIVTFLAKETRGSGIPEVMEAIFTTGGKIRARVAPLRALASSILAGSGGSVGREGPIVQIGSAVSSLVAQLLKLKRTEMRVLVACGAAAGISATFNSPLAGAFFAHEVVLMNFSADTFFPVVVSSVVASIIGYAAFGSEPTFRIPEYSIETFTEMPLFLLLGVVLAVAGVIFTRLLYSVESLFKRSHIPAYLAPAAGGLAVGLIAYFDPRVLGIGYDIIGDFLRQEYVVIGSVILLALLKILATSLSIGSGGSGGLVAPSLFLGAAIGGALGQAANAWGAMTTPSAYALVGMGGAFAATSHAPITSVLTVFELTRDYNMMLPLMLTCGVSTIAARVIYRFSIFNLQLVRHGVHYSLTEDTRLLDQVTVQEAMVTDVITVAPDTTVAEASHLFDESKHHGFPVADADDTLHGIVTLEDVRKALENDMQDATVQEAGTHELVVAFPDESLNDALRKLGLRDIGRLPVVDRDDHTKLLGLVTRKNIIAAYNRALIRRHTHLRDTVQSEHIE